MTGSSILAYVGPGPGLTAAWAFFALLGTIALAILSVLIWPIRVVIRRLRGAPPPPDDTSTTKVGNEGAAGPQ